jgi:hypothetical protein
MLIATSWKPAIGWRLMRIRRFRKILPTPDFARTGRMADAIGKRHDWTTIDLEESIMQLKGGKRTMPVIRQSGLARSTCWVSIANWCFHQLRQGSFGVYSAKPIVIQNYCTAARAR